MPEGAGRSAAEHAATAASAAVRRIASTGLACCRLQTPAIEPPLALCARAERQPPRRRPADRERGRSLRRDRQPVAEHLPPRRGAKAWELVFANPVRVATGLAAAVDSAHPWVVGQTSVRAQEAFHPPVSAPLPLLPVSGRHWLPPMTDGTRSRRPGSCAPASKWLT